MQNAKEDVNETDRECKKTEKARKGMSDIINTR